MRINIILNNTAILFWRLAKFIESEVPGKHKKPDFIVLVIGTNFTIGH